MLHLLKNTPKSLHNFLWCSFASSKKLFGKGKGQDTRREEQPQKYRDGSQDIDNNSSEKSSQKKKLFLKQKNTEAEDAQVSKDQLDRQKNKKTLGKPEKKQQQSQQPQPDKAPSTMQAPVRLFKNLKGKSEAAEGDEDLDAIGKLQIPEFPKLKYKDAWAAQIATQGIFFTSVGPLQIAGTYKPDPSLSLNKQPNRIDTLRLRLTNIQESSEKDRLLCELAIAENNPTRLTQVLNSTQHPEELIQFKLRHLSESEATVEEAISIFLGLGASHSKKLHVQNIEAFVNNCLKSKSITASSIEKMLNHLTKNLEISLGDIRLVHLESFLRRECEGKFDENSKIRVRVFVNLAEAILKSTRRADSQPIFVFLLATKSLLSSLWNSSFRNAVFQICQDLYKHNLLNQNSINYGTLCDVFLSSKKRGSLTKLVTVGKTIKDPKFISVFRSKIIKERLMQDESPFSSNHEQLLSLYGVCRLEKDEVALNMLCLIATLNKIPEVSFDLYHNYESLLKSQPSKLVEQCFIESLLQQDLEGANANLREEIEKRSASNLTISLKMLIRLGDYEGATTRFEESELIKKTIRYNMTQRVRNFLYIYYSTLSEDKLSLAKRQIDKFIFEELSAQYLGRLYELDNIYNVKIAEFLPENYEEFWAEAFKEKRVNELVQAKNQGRLGERVLEGMDRGYATLENEKLLGEVDARIQAEAEQYEIDKPLVSHLLGLKAIIQAARVNTNEKMQTQVEELEQTVTSQIQQKLEAFGLFGIQLSEHQLDDLQLAVQNMLDSPNYTRIDEQSLPHQIFAKSEREQINLRRLSREEFEKARHNYPEIWQHAKNLTKIYPLNEVEELLTWGVMHKEPLAVYMGEKLAQLTGQQISHHTALAVSRFLSPSAQNDPTVIEKAKEALSLIGKIERDRIYDFSKEYDHVLERKEYLGYVNNVESELQFLNKQLLQNIKARPVRRWDLKPLDSYTLLRQAKAKYAI